MGSIFSRIASVFLLFATSSVDFSSKLRRFNSFMVFAIVDNIQLKFIL